MAFKSLSSEFIVQLQDGRQVQLPKLQSVIFPVVEGQ